MAYVLGFFAADGYITVNKRGGQFWCIQITDKNLLENIKKIVGAEHKICVRPRTGNENAQYRLQIGSIEMCDDLRKLGFNERKTKNLAIPRVPRKYMGHFIRGYFDGDGNVWAGYIHKKRRVQTMSCLCAFTSCSLNFLKQLRAELLSFGLKSGSLYQPKPNCFRLQFSTLDSLKLYDFMYTGIARGNQLCLRRKRVVFEKFIRLRL